MTKKKRTAFQCAYLRGGVVLEKNNHVVVTDFRQGRDVRPYDRVFFYAFKTDGPFLLIAKGRVLTVGATEYTARVSELISEPDPQGSLVGKTAWEKA